MTDPEADPLAYCTANRRVCPVPVRWNELFGLLPNRRPLGSGWEPPLPLILAAWWHSTDVQKQERLGEHIAHAAKHGELPRIAAFLKALPERDWHHQGQ